MVLLGGSARCIEAILSDQRLEALPSSTDLRFDLWSDRVNPRPPRDAGTLVTACRARGRSLADSESGYQLIPFAVRTQVVWAIAELLIDCEEDRTLRAVLVGMLREGEGR